MAGRFHRVLLCAIPGVLALVGCWWLYSQRKKYASSNGEEETAAEEQQEEVPAASVEVSEAVKNMDFVGSGCTMWKSVTHQNSKPEEISTKTNLLSTKRKASYSDPT